MYKILLYKTYKTGYSQINRMKLKLFFFITRLVYNKICDA